MREKSWHIHTHKNVDIRWKLLNPSMHKFFNDSICELSSCCSASDVWSTDSLAKGLVDSVSDVISEEWESHMLEHCDRREKQRWRVSDIHSCNIQTRMSSALCEEDVIITNNGTSLQTNTTSDTSTNVTDNRTVEIWHDHNIELPGRFHELHLFDKSKIMKSWPIIH